MILIADSGSTKTHWAFINSTSMCSVSTKGLNPLLTDDATLLEVFTYVYYTLCSDNCCTEVWFYGAGCGSERMRERVKQLLQSVFSGASIFVCGDILGACRAACGSKQGLVGIVGTGSNLCYYDGIHIAQQRPSTGYILGDEGSGNHIGRCLLKAYLEQRMPHHIDVMFHDNYGMDYNECIDHLYHQPNANRFLASLAPFAAHHLQEPYIEQLVADCFDAFFTLMDDYAKWEPISLYLIGGLTSDFSRPLHCAAARHHRTITALIPDPMPGLIQYHLHQ